MRSIIAIVALSVTGTLAQGKAPTLVLPGPKAASPIPAPPPPVAPAPHVPAVNVPKPAPAAPPTLPRVPKAPVPPLLPKGPPPPKLVPGGKAPGPGVIPPPGVVLPNLSGTAKNFPPGPEVNSPKLNIQGAPGAYSIALIEHVAFPNRTLYLPQGVPAGVKVPIFAWENGICYQYGRMYQGFLQEIASHGYLVVVPGRPNELGKKGTTADWQLESIAQARAWTTAPFEVDKTKVAIAGHSCGGSETLRNLGRTTSDQVTTGIVMNSAGQSEAYEDIDVPILLVHGGQTDTENRADANFDWVSENKEDTPIAEIGLQTGHLGSYWRPRGGIYAETVVRWLNWNLKGNANEKLYFSGGKESPAAKRGWQIKTNNIGDS